MCDCEDCLHKEVLDKPLPEPRDAIDEMPPPTFYGPAFPGRKLTVEELAEMLRACGLYIEDDLPIMAPDANGLATMLLPILRERRWVR